MSRISSFALVAALTATFALASTGCASAQNNSDSAASASSDTEYDIEEVADGLYRFKAGHYRSVFAVTNEGIIVTDPISTEAATWLRAELDRRFDVPVRFVIYSHSHSDHTYGGEVFAQPGVTFVAHEMARAQMVRTQANTEIPNLTFADELTLQLGDQSVTLQYHGPNNGKGSVSMLFRPSNTLFVVDWIVLGRLPYTDLPGYDLAGMIASTEQVLDMPFDRFIGGHADMGDKDDIRRYLDYITQLYNEVVEGMHAGKSLEQLQRELQFSDFSDLAMFEEWREQNIRGAYEQLRDEAYMLRRPEVPGPEAH
jgi:glyoxylase-like metal-dependent hydrolase (beta-lactamase superfamily II)